MDFAKYQSKSVSPVDEYVWTLSDELKEVARVELGETDEVRTKALAELRDRILNSPRILKCRMDSNFLLRFLRFRKFDVPKAMIALERWLVAREGAYGSDWMSNLDFSKPNIEGMIDRGIIMAFPKRDKNGRTLLLLRPAAMKTQIKTIGEESLTLSTMITELLLEDEENQIRGLNYICNVAGITWRHYFIFPFSTWYQLFKNVEHMCAFRHKGFNVVNMHSGYKLFLKIMLSHMPDKLKKRVKLTTFDEIDFMDRENFPVRYGGNVPNEDFIEPIRKRLAAKKEFFLSYANMKVDLALYPKDVVNCVPKALGKEQF